LQSHTRYGLQPLNLHCNPGIYVFCTWIFTIVDVFFVFVEDQFDKGIKMLLLDGANVKQTIAIGRITWLLGVESYHGKPIFEKYYSIGVEEALDGKVPLFVKSEANDPPQGCSRDHHFVGLWIHCFSRQSLVLFCCFINLCKSYNFWPFSTIRLCITCFIWTKSLLLR
jgi:hypothetical protein